MAKMKNKYVYSDDKDYLSRLADELAFIGRDHLLDLKNGMLVQYVLPQRKQKKKEEKRGKR